MNYQNAKIYKITSDVSDDQYIGSTCLSLKLRMRFHKNGYKRWKDGRNQRYLSSFKIFDQGDYDYELIENYPCDTKNELHTRERYWIENSPNHVNIQIPSRSAEEYDRFRSESRKTKIICSDCGILYTKHNKKKHDNSKRHLNCEIVKFKNELKNDLASLQKDIDYVNSLDLKIDKMEKKERKRKYDIEYQKKRYNSDEQYRTYVLNKQKKSNLKKKLKKNSK